MTIQIRKAQQSDAEKIARLYIRVYNGNYSLKEYTAPDSIKKIIIDRKYIWYIAHHEKDVIGSAVGVIEKWNKSFEIGRTVVDNNFSNKGIGTALCENITKHAFKNGLNIQWGTLRDIAIYNIAKKLDMTVVGYLPGLHKPKKRETHLMTLRISQNAKNKRISVGNPIYTLPYVKKIIENFGLEDVKGEYPQETIVGPESNRTATFKTQYHQGDNSTIITSADKFFASSDYLQVTLLADKTDAIRFFEKLGFEMCAFLPAWFEKDRKRYDCVLMANPIQEPSAHDKTLEEMVKEIKSGFRK